MAALFHSSRSPKRRRRRSQCFLCFSERSRGATATRWLAGKCAHNSAQPHRSLALFPPNELSDTSSLPVGGGDVLGAARILLPNSPATLESRHRARRAQGTSRKSRQLLVAVARRAGAFFRSGVRADTRAPSQACWRRTKCSRTTSDLPIQRPDQRRWSSQNSLALWPSSKRRARAHVADNCRCQFCRDSSRANYHKQSHQQCLSLSLLRPLELAGTPLGGRQARRRLRIQFKEIHPPLAH